ncbi:MAG: hypothetical protein EOO90_19040 [Pedobacter sp.]|nr:MAG: hypothetical protein EOO90_19040 [Pedobacter sp.]
MSELKIKNEFSANLSTNETLSFEVSIKSNHLINDHRIGIKISNSDGAPVGLLFTEAIINLNSNEEVEVIIDITSHNLAKGIYMIDFSLGTGNEESPIKDIHIISEALIIEIAKKDVNSDSIIVNWNALNWGNNHFIESSITLISKKKY